MNMYTRDDGKRSSKYPDDRLLPLRDMITEERIREPDMLDHDNKTCLFVIKNGSATGVTIGSATGTFSFVRDDDTGQESMEWAIYNYDNRLGVFSTNGDSASIIVDGLGRIGGLLTGGTGKTDIPDVTYATPMWWFWPRIKQHLPHHHGLGTAKTRTTLSTLASSIPSFSFTTSSLSPSSLFLSMIYPFFTLRY